MITAVDKKEQGRELRSVVGGQGQIARDDAVRVAGTEPDQWQTLSRFKLQGDPESCSHQDAGYAKKEGENREDRAPLLLVPSEPMSFSQFFFLLQLLQLSLEAPVVHSKDARATFLSLRNHLQPPKSQQRVQQWFFTFAESKTPLRLLTSKKKNVIHSSEQESQGRAN